MPEAKAHAASRARARRGTLITLLLSVMLAVFLWLYANDELEGGIDLNGDFTVEAPEGYRVVQSHDKVRVSLRGPRRVVESLRTVSVHYAPPELRGAETEKLEVPLSGDMVRALPPHVQVVGFVPESVSLDISRVTTKRLPVRIQFDGEPADGYVIDLATSTVSPPEVSVTGPSSLLEGEQSATLVIKTAAVNVRFKTESFFRSGVTLEQEINDKPVECGEKVDVQVTIQRRWDTAQLEKVPVLIARPTDYRYEVYSSSPWQTDITVTGPPRQLENLKPADVRVILDVTGLAPKPVDDQTPYTVRCRVVFPPGANLALAGEAPEVTFEVRERPAETP